MEIADDALAGERPFRLRVSHVLEMNRLAVDGLVASAGAFRTVPVGIRNSTHNPPTPDQVPGLVDDMCDYINDNWGSSPIHLASYLMWRINWIHPFVEGNGRTARMIAYMVLCIRLAHKLPGTSTIPAQIAQGRQPYYDALDEADAADARGTIDVSAMEELVSNLLAKQLVDLFDQAR